MRTVAWRKTQKLTQTELAGRLGVTQPYISSLERARNPAVPNPGLMVEIYLLTGGSVRPEDFYDLPDLGQKAAA